MSLFSHNIRGIEEIPHSSSSQTATLDGCVFGQETLQFERSPCVIWVSFSHRTSGAEESLVERTYGFTYTTLTGLKVDFIVVECFSATKRAVGLLGYHSAFRAVGVHLILIPFLPGCPTEHSVLGWRVCYLDEALHRRVRWTGSRAGLYTGGPALVNLTGLKLRLLLRRSFLLI